MTKQTQTVSNAMGTLAEDARALVAATADVAGDKVAQARQRLGSALASGKELLDRARDKTYEGAQAADQLVRENPYRTVAIALGIGAVIGYLLGRRDRD